MIVHKFQSKLVDKIKSSLMELCRDGRWLTGSGVENGQQRRIIRGINGRRMQSVVERGTMIWASDYG